MYILFRGGQPAGEYVVTAKPVPGFPRGCIGLSDPQRKWANITMQDELMGQAYDPLAQGGENYLNSVDAEIGFLSTSREGNAPVPEEALADFFRGTFNGHMFAPGQRTLMKFGDLPPLLVTIKAVSLFDRSLSSGGADHPMKSEPRTRGIVSPSTVVNFARVAKFNMIPSKTKPKANPILASDFKFEDMGIGGLGDEFSTIFRRAFASRILPAGLATSIGLDQVKGLLLYGPPGTGKTLIARQIGKMLNAREPKVINGPEVLNKYVGQSEENIRKLFADAEKEYAEKGDDSELHIIIFDELDAICKQRGSGSGGGTGVGDNVVNQLLSKMDGVEQLNNILIIGMTNRKDLIDEALLRPGRLEVHIEIELPDEAGRLEILKIHTAKMRDNGLVESDVNLEELAGLTKNFSGAELYGLIRSAASFTFSRHIEVGKMAAVKQDLSDMKVRRDDFMQALQEVHPAYGVAEADLQRAVRLGIIRYSPHVNANIQSMTRVVNMIRDDGDKTSTSVLFHGPRASGKTALAVHIARESEFPFIKMIRAVDLIGYRDDSGKRDHVQKAFSDAWKSPTSILILDDFERLIQWSPVGPRYSATMLETLTTLIVTEPPEVSLARDGLWRLLIPRHANTLQGSPSRRFRDDVAGVGSRHARGRQRLRLQGGGPGRGRPA